MPRVSSAAAQLLVVRHHRDFMTQDDINQSEWSKSANWSALSYSSRADSRLFVPKRRSFGWTINFGHAGGKFVFGAFLALPAIIILGVWLFSKR